MFCNAANLVSGANQRKCTSIAGYRSIELGQALNAWLAITRIELGQPTSFSPDLKRRSSSFKSNEYKTSGKHGLRSSGESVSIQAIRLSEHLLGQLCLYANLCL